MKNRTILFPEMVEIPTSPTPNKFKFSPIFIIILLSLIFVSSISAAYYYGVYQNRVSPPITTISPAPTESVPTPKPVNGQIVWLDKPQKIAALEIFDTSKDNPDIENGGYHFSEARFYETATLPDGSKLINVYIPTDGMGIYDTLFRFIKTTEGKITFVDEYKTQWSYVKNILAPQVTLSSFNVRELDPPDSLYITSGNSNVYFKKGYLIEKTFDKLVNPKLVESTEFGELYAVYQTQKENPDIVSREFYLKLKDWSVFSYTESLPFFSDNMTVYLDWSDNSQVKSQFLNKIASGCGTGFFGPDTIKASSSLLASKVQVATHNQSPIYQIKDVNSTILKQLYEAYKTRYFEPTDTPVLSFEDFINAKNHFLYQDFLGDWLIFINQDYAVQAECGKPVVYLYPTTDTVVSVSVGASVTQSEPKYIIGTGWTGVLAHPNGQLDYQGQTYPNLFWEGQGFGPYPNIGNYGFVVPQKKLISTLKIQLAQLGLNTQESADFIEFWTPRLPSTPFVRLTWFGTAEMNQLAPLSVNPRPDTTIRIFLDFAGLEKSVKLTPQKLTSIPRVGFTLVEWGGLLVK